MAVSKRFIGTIDLSVFADLTATNDPKKVSYSDRRKIEDLELQNFISQDLIVLDTAIKTITFGDTYRYLFIFTDQPITVKFNGGSQVINITSFFIVDGLYTSIEITNASGEDASIKIGYGA